MSPYVRKEWGLSDPQIGLMLSLGIFGLAIGALLRRRSSVASGSQGRQGRPGCLAAPAFSGDHRHDFATFCLFRVLLGISLGMLSRLAFVYVNEWAPAQRANLFATITLPCPFRSGIAAGLAGLVIARIRVARSLHAGRLLAILSGALPATLPESASRLIRLHRLDEVRRQLAPCVPSERHLCGATSFTAGAGLPAERPGFGLLLRPPFQWRTIGIWTASALSLLCLHGLSGWLPSILISQGAAISSAFGYGVLLMSMQIVGGGAFGWASDAFGRPRVMAVGFIGGAAALVGLSQLVGTPITFVAVAAAGFFIFGTQAVMNNFTAMSYPPACAAPGPAPRSRSAASAASQARSSSAGRKRLWRNLVNPRHSCRSANRRQSHHLRFRTVAAVRRNRPHEPLTLFCPSPAASLARCRQAMPCSNLRSEARKGYCGGRRPAVPRLDGNGTLTPYEDWRLPAERRAQDLIRRMTLEEAAFSFTAPRRR